MDSYGVGIVVSAWALEEDDWPALVVAAFWFSVVLSAPLILLGLLSLAAGLFMGLFPGTPIQSEGVKLGAILVLTGIMPFVGFCAAGWSSQRGFEILTGVSVFEDRTIRP